MHFSRTVALGAVALSTQASAYLAINNWCSQTVSFYLSHNGGCDYGSAGSGVCDGTPYTIPAGTIAIHNWIEDGEGTAMKMTLGTDFSIGILQFEYAVSNGIYWDLSDLDGAGPGLVGTPFYNYNVKVSPTGDGQGTGTCLQIKCPADQVCVNAYQVPDQAATRWCPTDTGTMWIDLCEPTANFNSKRAELSFSARRGRGA